MNEKLTHDKYYQSIFFNDVPLLDVRSPSEYSKGSFPNAINRPILDDEQRILIGTCYKKKGHDAAINLAHQLATNDLKQARINDWVDFAEKNPDGYLFCFRGGERSHTTQAWLKSAGYDLSLIKGGYKVMRHFLIERLEQAIHECKIIVLSGKTGTGKTQLLNLLSGSIDLEDIANHRGSSFGKRIGGQPTQIDFENRLSIAFLKHAYLNPGQPIILEDESKLIGRCSLPVALTLKMHAAPVVLLEESLDKRVDMCTQEYIIKNLQDLNLSPENAASMQNFFVDLKESLFRIKRRLGGLRYQQRCNELEIAINEYQSSYKVEAYRPLITGLLTEYYDPMYEYQFEKKKGQVIFRGSKNDIFEKITTVLK